MEKKRRHGKGKTVLKRKDCIDEKRLHRNGNTAWTVNDCMEKTA